MASLVGAPAPADARSSAAAAAAAAAADALAERLGAAPGLGGGADVAADVDAPRDHDGGRRGGRAPAPSAAAKAAPAPAPAPGGADADVAALVERLELAPHPEGGFYRETFRDAAPAAAAPGQAPHGAGSAPARGASTAILYLLRARDKSRLHRLDASEVWHAYLGEPPGARPQPPPLPGLRRERAQPRRARWLGLGRRAGRSSAAQRAGHAAASPPRTLMAPAGPGREGWRIGHRRLAHAASQRA
jgi:hypothetical protein